MSISPSSAASSLAYTNYHQNHCTAVPSYGAPVPLPQAFVPSAYANSRVPPILDSSGMLPPPYPIRSPLSSSTHATERETYTTPSLARPQLSPGGYQPGFASYPETPRSALSSITGLSLSNASYPYTSGHHSQMASPTYGNQQNDCGNFPWPNLEIHAEMTCEGQAVTPEVHAKVEKGFFLSTVDTKWTCYRRNYFSVQCHFELHPNITNGRMQLKKNNSAHSETIQAMGMRLSAAVDGSAGKNIELVQHTPKRDAGPKNKIDIVKVSPTPSNGGRGEHTVSPHGIYQVPMSTFHATGSIPGPNLPFQNLPEPGSPPTAAAQASQTSSNYPYSASTASHLPLPGQAANHIFERVQFKQATANNGKRRASQQYFHLIVELYADVRKNESDAPSWVKVAHRVSEKIVVRGRSPSHYQNEGQNCNGRTGSSGGSSSYSTAGGAPTYGGIGSGGFRASSTGYTGGLAGASYRSNTYGFHPSPEHSGSSASSVDGGAQDSDYPPDAVMSDTERSEFQNRDEYRYYPGTIYEGVPQGGLPLPKIESTARYSTDPSSWAVKHESYDTSAGVQQQWPVNGLSRFQGVDSSRGFYPDLANQYT
ncbi:hypothetical protein DOTSEDRAFT_48613 [Dothistroma septosporum NZE10]|uniref:NDT80 domain-containing protein n=1 Tax=Dothistroma septosporum (strain NZE10 / CBS 128990) TaxID=675120 RepID=N1PBI7_DOTSN|nr:hypothetical protein DOTSEDRAFT_48613 [Dothistroma septosporum NZE10]